MAAKRRVSEKEEAVFSKNTRHTMSKDGVMHFVLLDTADPKDKKFYEQLLNNHSRYEIHERSRTWNKSKGLTLGMTIAVEYTDLFPELPE